MTRESMGQQPPPDERVAEDAASAARLRALGYVSGNAPRKARYTRSGVNGRPQMRTPVAL